RASDPSQELQVRPRITIGGDEAPQGRLLGAAGVLDIEELADEQLLARLAPLGAAVPRALRTLLHRRRPLVVPAADREAFLEVAYPQLRALTTITSEDGSIELPAARRPTLHLEAAYASGDRLSLRWSWRYHDPERQLPMDQRHGAHRDLAHEEAVIAEAMTPRPASPDDTPDLLSGTYTARFTQQTSPGKNDWFDLGFEITIEGRQIPFPSLFVALAQGRSTLLMPDRTYFSLDHPAFDGLRELIREGEALAEWEPEQQQISRF